MKDKKSQMLILEAEGVEIELLQEELSRFYHDLSSKYPGVKIRGSGMTEKGIEDIKKVIGGWK